MTALLKLEALLQERVRRDESLYAGKQTATDSLWSHLQRVAGFAVRVGTAEGADPEACRLAGLFHDAGKFCAGNYHEGDVPEEKLSVDVLRELAADVGLGAGLVSQVSDAILELYRDNGPTSLLGRVLFDADNLDKLGPLGIANYFVKTGLRGKGLSEQVLYSLTVELTYARYAARVMTTATGRELAAARANQTVAFIAELLDALRQDGVYDFRISEENFDDITVTVVAPVACRCGGDLIRRLWGKEGVKCSEVHLEHSCAQCASNHVFRFCRPRLVG